MADRAFLQVAWHCLREWHCACHPDNLARPLPDSALHQVLPSCVECVECQLQISSCFLIHDVLCLINTRIIHDVTGHKHLARTCCTCMLPARESAVPAEKHALLRQSSRTCQHLQRQCCSLCCTQICARQSAGSQGTPGPTAGLGRTAAILPDRPWGHHVLSGNVAALLRPRGHRPPGAPHPATLLTLGLDCM